MPRFRPAPHPLARWVAVTAFALLLPAGSARAAVGQLGLKALPFTGVTLPLQQISGYRPSLPLGIGVEVYYGERFSLAVDLTTSWHDGGPGGDANVQVSSLQLLARWWPSVPWRARPFLQVGAGGYQAEVDEGNGERQYGGVGGAFGGGLEFPVWRRLFLQTEIRSNWAKGEDTSRKRKLWIGHTQALAWFVYRFP